MKINRTVRVIAVILALAMMPLWMFGCGKLGSTVTSRLASMMVGDGSLSMDYASSKAYIDALDADVKNISSRFSAQTWPASALTGSESTRTQHFKNIYTLTKAWATKKSAYYHDGDVLSMIKSALEYGAETLYSFANSRSENESAKTMTERCDSAEYLVRSLLILSDAGKVKDSLVEQCLDIVNIKFPSPFGEASDYIRVLYITIGAAALQGENDKIISTMENYVTSAITLTESGSGLYADGSFLLNEVASSGSYGTVAFNILVEIATAVAGTDADFAEDVNIKDFLYSWAVNSVIPSLYNGSAFAGTVGSYLADADKMGGLALSGLLGLAEFLDDERSDEIRAIVKGYCESNNTAFAPGFTSYGACQYQKVEKNSKLEGKKVEGAFSFAEMDKLTVLGTKYSASLSLSSKRSVKYETRAVYSDSLTESIGAVNGSGWYTGDGMLLLYTQDYQVSEKYWTYVNSKRIPGTTVDSRDRVPANDGGFDGVTSDAGSAVLGNNAVSSYFFVNNNSELRSDLTAKKSYFFFNDKIVALGAGITNTYVDNLALNQTVETVVENVIYGSSASVAISVDDDLTLAANTVTPAPGVMYIMKYGGIYIPEDKNDALYCRINSTNGDKLNFFELWIDHGMLPEKATYEYVIVPSSVKKMDAFFEFAAAPTYTVLSNSEQVQAVKDDETGLVGITFWEAAECNGIKTDFACNMLVKDTDTTLTLAVSDYTHFGAGNKTGGTITLEGNYTLKTPVEGVTINGNVITIDRAVAANGSTLTIVLSK